MVFSSFLVIHLQNYQFLFCHQWNNFLYMEGVSINILRYTLPASVPSKAENGKKCSLQWTFFIFKPFLINYRLPFQHQGLTKQFRILRRSFKNKSWFTYFASQPGYIHDANKGVNDRRGKPLKTIFKTLSSFSLKLCKG